MTSCKTIVNAGLILLLIGISYFHISNGLEYFDEVRCGATSLVSGAMSSVPAPLDQPKEASVYSSLPPQREKDSSWQYLAPYQSGCLSSSGASAKKSKQCIRCFITPHNQRYCQWS